MDNEYVHRKRRSADPRGSYIDQGRVGGACAVDRHSLDVGRYGDGAGGVCRLRRVPSNSSGMKCVHTTASGRTLCMNR